MTRIRSGPGAWIAAGLHFALFLAVLAWIKPPPLITLILVLIVTFNLCRDGLQRGTLRQDETGVYAWIEWHGGERRSCTDPSEPGGAWDSEGGDSDGGGD